jgi:drug/metabolite transporter (DMT)-like permease
MTGTSLGIIWLGEKHWRPQIIGAVLIASGVVFIGLGR